MFDSRVSVGSRCFFLWRLLDGTTELAEADIVELKASTVVVATRCIGLESGHMVQVWEIEHLFSFQELPTSSVTTVLPAGQNVAPHRVLPTQLLARSLMRAWFATDESAASSMEGVPLPTDKARVDQMTSVFASAVDGPSASAASASAGMPNQASSLGGDAAKMAAIMASFQSMMGGGMGASTKGVLGPGDGDSSGDSSSSDDEGTVPGAARAGGIPGASASAGAQGASSSAAPTAAPAAAAPAFNPATLLTAD